MFHCVLNAPLIFDWKVLTFNNYCCASIFASQPAFICAKLAIETLEKGVKCHLVLVFVNFEHIIAGWDIKNTLNPMTSSVHKMVKHILKYCSICCKIFKVCLTILWTLDVIIGLRTYVEDMQIHFSIVHRYFLQLLFFSGLVDICTNATYIKCCGSDYYHYYNHDVPQYPPWHPKFLTPHLSKDFGP